MRIKSSGNSILDINPNSKNYLNQVQQRIRVIIERRQRLGDLVMCLPVAKYFSLTHDVFFATMSKYKGLFNLLPQDITYEDLGYDRQKYNQVIDLNLNHSHNFQNINTKIKMFFASAGVDPNILSKEDLKPSIKAPDQYKLNLNTMGRKILISNISYNINGNRSIPIQRFLPLFQELDNDHFIVSSISPQGVEKLNNISNFSSNTPSLSDFVDLINQVDIVISVDTGALHLACALNKPVVALFGPTSPIFFAGEYSDIISIDADPNRTVYWDSMSRIYFEELPIELLINSINKITSGYKGNCIIGTDGSILSERSK